MLVLRTCEPDMSSYSGFIWPESGLVECSDWIDNYRCGNGLHGLPWGEGAGYLLNWESDAKWLVVEVDDHLVKYGKDDMLQKCKFPRGNVVFCGNRKDATDYLLAHGAADKAVVGCWKTGEDYSTLTGGYRSTLTGGYGSTLTGGDRSTLTGGDRSTLTGGNWSTLTGGYRSTLTWRIWDGEFYIFHTVYVGENGIKPNTPYEFVYGKVREE
jgi:hypothetical protein